MGEGTGRLEAAGDEKFGTLQQSLTSTQLSSLLHGELYRIQGANGECAIS